MKILFHHDTSDCVLLFIENNTPKTVRELFIEFHTPEMDHDCPRDQKYMFWSADWIKANSGVRYRFSLHPQQQAYVGRIAYKGKMSLAVYFADTPPLTFVFDTTPYRPPQNPMRLVM